MDALVMRCAILACAVASMGASYRSANFIIDAPTPEQAQQIGQAAEKYRRELAMDWLGKEMPNWAQPCPIQAHVAPNLGAGGATSFEFANGEVFGWRMTIQGSHERILDSVLPHEVTHMVFATHFRRPLPRWADEGACTTVEHESEKAKQQQMLIEFLHTNRGIAFSKMFAMREYPRDVMPLYSQGFSLARYLIQQGGKRKFLAYVGDGMRDENWSRATKQHYGHENLLALQNSWLEWVRTGSPKVDSPIETPALVAANTASPGPSDAAPQSRVEAFPPEPAESLASAATGGSVYAQARSGGSLPPAEAADWQTRGSSKSDSKPLAVAQPNSNGADTVQAGPRVEAPLDKLPGPAYQVTRPQEIQRPRQVILEWSRPPGSGAAHTASRNLPGPR
jgi:hypothetical protein